MIGVLTVREEILPVVGLGDVLHEDPYLEEFETSEKEGMDFALGAVHLSSGDVNVCVHGSSRNVLRVGRLWAGGSHQRQLLSRQAASVEHRAVFAVRFQQLKN